MSDIFYSQGKPGCLLMLYQHTLIAILSWRDPNLQFCRRKEGLKETPVHPRLWLVGLTRQTGQWLMSVQNSATAQYQLQLRGIGKPEKYRNSRNLWIIVSKNLSPIPSLHWVYQSKNLVSSIKVLQQNIGIMCKCLFCCVKPQGAWSLWLWLWNVDFVATTQTGTNHWSQATICDLFNLLVIVFPPQNNNIIWHL